nr:cysteine-rich protein 3 isoform X3 [Manis javanica]
MSAAELRGRLGRWHHLRFTGPPHMKTFTGETSLCPGCEEPVYFAEKVMSLGRNWHRPCLRCQRCRKTLTAGSHAEVNREGMVVLLGGGRLKMGRQPSSDGSLSLCPSMMAFPIATSPAMATCLAPKVGSPTPDMWVWGICGQLPGWSNMSQAPPNSLQPSAQHPQPPPRPMVIRLSPSGVNIGDVGCYIYDPVEIKSK